MEAMSAELQPVAELASSALGRYFQHQRRCPPRWTAPLPAEEALQSLPELAAGFLSFVSAWHTASCETDENTNPLRSIRISEALSGFSVEEEW